MIKKRIIDFLKKAAKELADLSEKAFIYLKTSWKSVAVVAPVCVFLYYFAGSMLTENIDKSLNFEIKKAQQGYTFIQTSADLIKREIDDHMFTPNLPFIFPASILDNMPSFQKGLIESLSNAIHVAAVELNIKELNKADSFLNYPANVWLFSKTADFKLEPSSTSQYRKSRRNLLQFNEKATVNKDILIKILESIKEDLTFVEQKLQKGIDLGVQMKADNIFYRAQGHLYADYMLIKSVQKDMNFDASQILKSLEKAILIQPKMVRNGHSGSLTVPNHLFELAYFVLKSKVALNEAIRNIKNAD